MKANQITRYAKVLLLLVMTIVCGGSEKIVLVFDTNLRIIVLNVDNKQLMKVS